MNTKKKIIKTSEDKQKESYPAIYTYISHSEDSDIKKLVNEFSNFKRKKIKLPEKAHALKIVNGELQIIPAQIVIKTSNVKLSVKKKDKKRKKSAKKITEKDLHTIIENSINS